MSDPLIEVVAKEMDRLGYGHHEHHAESILHVVRAVLAQEAGPVGECQEPISCGEVNEENAPTFMGEPNPNHSIDWYREGIAKHWKTICCQRSQIAALTESIKFYADRDHYSTDDGLNWDSCSGEPMNILWHESEPWFIEDGSIARTCLDKVKELNQ
jgi:hypothetical protein